MHARKREHTHNMHIRYPGRGTKASHQGSLQVLEPLATLTKSDRRLIASKYACSSLVECICVKEKLGSRRNRRVPVPLLKVLLIRCKEAFLPLRPHLRSVGSPCSSGRRTSTEKSASTDGKLFCTDGALGTMAWMMANHRNCGIAHCSRATGQKPACLHSLHGRLRLVRPFVIVEFIQVLLCSEAVHSPQTKRSHVCNAAVAQAHNLYSGPASLIERGIKLTNSVPDLSRTSRPSKAFCWGQTLQTKKS